MLFLVTYLKTSIPFFAILITNLLWCQHQTKLVVELLDEKKMLTVQQEILFHNTSKDTISKIVLNDWNNAFSAKNTPLAKRFSDEFVRSFHLSKTHEKGSTQSLVIIDQDRAFLEWCRPDLHPDIVEVTLRKKLNPGEKIKINLVYYIKLPKDKFTKFGYNENGNYYLRDCFILPARSENGKFTYYSQLNCDDIANAPSDIDLIINVPKQLEITTDLNELSLTEEKTHKIYRFNEERIQQISLVLETKKSFERYRNDIIEVNTNLKENRIDAYQKAISIDKITRFVEKSLGQASHSKIVVSQVDYERNPFYGLNQLPSFISPFPDSFLYEIKFLKTYLHQFLKQELRLDPRKDNWIYDALQVYIMMNYIDEYYPDMKMMGNLSKFKLVKGYNLMQINFNEQYSYYYMLMARKNLDQPIGDPKNTLLKFNEQIAGKYRAGLSLKYLDNYLEKEIVPTSIKTFFDLNKRQQTERSDFEKILKVNSKMSLDWFFDTVINSRDIIDYTFSKVEKSKDSISIVVKNKTGVTVPIPLYGLQKKEVVYKKWLENVQTDTLLTFSSNEFERLVLNYKNEVPEYNLRNNWKSFKGFFNNNRPFKFNFLKDLEDPYHNQILYVPTLEYNLYNGIMPGMRIHNKTFLDKPLIFDFNPAYSFLTEHLIGNFSVIANDFKRNSRLFLVRYSFSGQFFDYAPDASYMRLTPMIQFRIRENDFRDNRRQSILVRQVIVDRERSPFVELTEQNSNYSVFNLKYFDVKTEIKNHFAIRTDLQIADSFGKASIELEYRNLFENNSLLQLRFFAGSFLYRNTTSEFFSFGLDRPTDYLFDYPLYGRSETSGFFSQQYVIAEGAFKSKLENPFANEWMTTFNSGINVWNWIEVYGDLGWVKNKNTTPQFVYDTGIRLNLVTDYFEVYLPVQSSNGWEISKPSYAERIRFMFTMTPDVLVGLFTRKWL